MIINSTCCILFLEWPVDALAGDVADRLSGVPQHRYAIEDRLVRVRHAVEVREAAALREQARVQWLHGTNKEDQHHKNVK